MLVIYTPEKKLLIELKTIYFYFGPKLKVKTKKNRENCVFDGTAIGDKLKITTEYVPLQMGEYQPNRDSNDAGHLHTRKEIIDRIKNYIFLFWSKIEGED